jgi:hypothetical protein
MYNISVTNNYHYSIAILPNGGGGGGGYQVINGGGGTATIEGWGYGLLDVPGMGPINFLDLGQQKLPAYTNPSIPWTELTWGGLIRYQGLEAYFRYEGAGQINVVVDQFGSVSVHFVQGGMLISVDDLSVI